MTLLEPNRWINRLELAEEIQVFAPSTAKIEFLPIGEDSWVYRCGELLISVRRDIQGHVPTAYEAAFELRNLGHEYVVAPLARPDGSVVGNIQGFPIVVFPFIEKGESLAQCRVISSESGIALTRLIDRLHCESSIRTMVPTEDFGLPFLANLERTIEELEGPYQEAGPFTRPLQGLIAGYRDVLRKAIRTAQDLGAECRHCADRFVLTHGEPSAANVIGLGSRLHIVDWGALRWAPPERDWFHTIRTMGVGPRYQERTLSFYEVRWFLSELAEYICVFAGAHDRSLDTIAMWERLYSCVAGTEAGYTPAWGIRDAE